MDMKNWKRVLCLTKLKFIFLQIFIVDFRLAAEARACTGVLGIHPQARDIKIDNFSVTFYGAELLQVRFTNICQEIQSRVSVPGYLEQGFSSGVFRAGFSSGIFRAGFQLRDIQSRVSAPGYLEQGFSSGIFRVGFSSRIFRAGFSSGIF